MTTLDGEDKRTQAAVLYLQGYTQAQVGARLGVAGCTVSTWLSDLRAEWKANAARDRFERIAKGLEELRLVAQAAWRVSDLRLVLKTLDIRFRVLGAYTVKLIPVQQTIPWDAIAATPADPIEARLAHHTTNGEAHAD